MILQRLFNNTFKRNAALLSILMIVPLFLSLIAQPASATGYAVERKVDTKFSIAAGTIVTGISDTDVRLASQHDSQRVLGVAMQTAKGALPDGTVGIVSSGVNSVLVSDINGNVKSGDRIAVSPIDGIGMKSQSPGWILGIVQANFATSDSPVVHQQVQSIDGKTSEISIKSLPVLLSISYYNPDSQTDNGSVTTVVHSFMQTIAGHPVSSKQAMVALAVFGIAIILLVTLVYSAVRSSLMAIGRNPLASGRINAGLIKVLLTTVIVVMATLSTVYAILR